MNRRELLRAGLGALASLPAMRWLQPFQEDRFTELSQGYIEPWARVELSGSTIRIFDDKSGRLVKADCDGEPWPLAEEGEGWYTFGTKSNGIRLFWPGLEDSLAVLDWVVITLPKGPLVSIE